MTPSVIGFVETDEQQALRKAVAAMAANYGQDYYLEKARAGQHTDELWRHAGLYLDAHRDGAGQPGKPVPGVH